MSELLEHEIKEASDYEKELYQIISSFDYESFAVDFKNQYNLGNELHILVDVIYENEGEDVECILEFKNIL